MISWLVGQVLTVCSLKAVVSFAQSYLNLSFSFYDEYKKERLQKR